MDDRKKRIIELEKSIKNSQIRLNVLLETLGKSLLNRPEINSADEKTFSDKGIFPNIEKYLSLQKEIENADASIKTIESKISRLHELDEEIDAKEQELAVNSKELTGMYSKLGKLILEDNSLDDFSAQYRAQAEGLIPKIQSLEFRLAELTDQTEGGNVFTWIGKGAQGMVLRSFLTKSMENLERLYKNAGEQFFRSRSENIYKNTALSFDISEQCGDIDNNKNSSAALSGELKKLRAEYKLIDDGFNASGGALKQIQGLKKHISQSNELLKALYLQFGTIVSNEKPAKAASSKKAAKELFSVINESEQLILDDIRQLRQSMEYDAGTIAKLKAALEIDEEKDKIDKFRRSISEKKARIEEAEQNIAEYESRIKKAQKRIEELQELL